jgi:uroporphyrinogen-III synthase
MTPEEGDETTGAPARPRVLVARPRAAASELAGLLTEAGFEPVVVPLVDTVPGDTTSELAAALAGPGGYAFVAFTSVAAVDAARALTADLPAPAAVVGPATRRAVLAAGWDVAVEAPGGTGADLAAALPPARPGSDRVLFPASAIAGDDFPSGAAARGWTVVQLEAYRTEPVALGAEEVEAVRSVDAAILTSPSIVRAYLAAAGDAGFPPVVVAMGPTTAAEVEAAGGRAVVAAERTPAGLVAALRGAIGGPDAPGDGASGSGAPDP